MQAKSKIMNQSIIESNAGQSVRAAISTLRTDNNQLRKKVLEQQSVIGKYHVMFSELQNKEEQKDFFIAGLKQKIEEFHSSFKAKQSLNLKEIAFLKGLNERLKEGLASVFQALQKLISFNRSLNSHLKVVAINFGAVSKDRLQKQITSVIQGIPSVIEDVIFGVEEARKLAMEEKFQQAQQSKDKIHFSLDFNQSAQPRAMAPPPKKSRRTRTYKTPRQQLASEEDFSQEVKNREKNVSQYIRHQSKQIKEKRKIQSDSKQGPEYSQAILRDDVQGAEAKLKTSRRGSFLSHVPAVNSIMKNSYLAQEINKMAFEINGGKDKTSVSSQMLQAIWSSSGSSLSNSTTGKNQERARVEIKTNERLADGRQPTLFSKDGGQKCMANNETRISRRETHKQETGSQLLQRNSLIAGNLHPKADTATQAPTQLNFKKKKEANSSVFQPMSRFKQHLGAESQYQYKGQHLSAESHHEHNGQNLSAESYLQYKGQHSSVESHQQNKGRHLNVESHLSVESHNKGEKEAGSQVSPSQYSLMIQSKYDLKKKTSLDQRMISQLGEDKLSKNSKQDSAQKQKTTSQGQAQVQSKPKPSRVKFTQQQPLLYINGHSKEQEWKESQAANKGIEQSDNFKQKQKQVRQKSYPDQTIYYSTGRTGLHHDKQQRSNRCGTISEVPQFSGVSSLRLSSSVNQVSKSNRHRQPDVEVQSHEQRSSSQSGMQSSSPQQDSRHSSREDNFWEENFHQKDGFKKEQQDCTRLLQLFEELEENFRSAERVRWDLVGLMEEELERMGVAGRREFRQAFRSRVDQFQRLTQKCYSVFILKNQIELSAR